MTIDAMDRPTDRPAVHTTDSPIGANEVTNR